MELFFRPVRCEVAGQACRLPLQSVFCWLEEAKLYQRAAEFRLSNSHRESSVSNTAEEAIRPGYEYELEKGCLAVLSLLLP